MQIQLENRKNQSKLLWRVREDLDNETKQCGKVKWRKIRKRLIKMIKHRESAIEVPKLLSNSYLIKPQNFTKWINALKNRLESIEDLIDSGALLGTVYTNDADNFKVMLTIPMNKIQNEYDFLRNEIYPAGGLGKEMQHFQNAFTLEVFKTIQQNTSKKSRISIYKAVARIVEFCEMGQINMKAEVSFDRCEKIRRRIDRASKEAKLYRGPIFVRASAFPLLVQVATKKSELK